MDGQDRVRSQHNDERSKEAHDDRDVGAGTVAFIAPSREVFGPAVDANVAQGAFVAVSAPTEDHVSDAGFCDGARVKLEGLGGRPPVPVLGNKDV